MRQAEGEGMWMVSVLPEVDRRWMEWRRAYTDALQATVLLSLLHSLPGSLPQLGTSDGGVDLEEKVDELSAGRRASPIWGEQDVPGRGRWPLQEHSRSKLYSVKKGQQLVRVRKVREGEEAHLMASWVFSYDMGE
jgi:hypothetical protein